MSWLNKKKKEEFTKYEPDVSKIKKVKEPVESIEVIDEPEIVEEAEEIEEPVKETETIAEDEEVEEKIEQAKKKKELTSRMIVVKELPNAPIRDYQDKDGTVHLITIEEAIGEILSILKGD